MLLTASHPLWTTAGSLPAKVAIATIQAIMISGRYRREALCRYWSGNHHGFCLLSRDFQDLVEDLPHIVETCPALEQTRLRLKDYTNQYIQEKTLNDDLRDLILDTF